MRPGVARGSHYHHSKTEKFLVVSGAAKMRFKHLLTDEYFEIELSASNPVIVDTIPGWIHDIVNTSDGETVVMLWANEVFDPSRPDTVAGKVA
jgi:UDP-2-acetamido-2,6-beta-L-arabino-hexul-4-ose reductase